MLLLTMLVFITPACCGKIKIIDAPFSFNNPSAGNPSLHGDSGNNVLIARVEPEQPSGPAYLIQNLYGRCFDLMSNNYKYVLCPFNNVTQREQSHRWNAFHGVLGIWKEWIITNNTFDSMHMLHGDVCSSTLDRQIKIKLSCGEQNEVVSVTEPSMCRYEMLFKTPYSCPKDVFEVYPVLSDHGKKKLQQIEEMFFTNEITLKGYEKRKKRLYIEEGLLIGEKSKENIKTKHNKGGMESNLNKLLSSSNENNENKSYMTLIKQFQSKAQCVEEYRKLSEEIVQLRAHVASLSLGINVTNHENNLTQYNSTIEIYSK